MKDIAIRENHLYNKAFKGGERASGKHVCVYVLRDRAARRQMIANPEKKYINRIGLSVTKRVGGAVERNRAKRVIRAALADARACGELRTGYLIVIAARVGCDGASSTEVGRELISAFERLGMYRTAEGGRDTNDKTEAGGR